MSSGGECREEVPPNRGGGGGDAAGAEGDADAPGHERNRSRGRSVVRRGGNEVVVHERVNYGSAIIYPMLTATNYVECSLVMKINLRAQGLWEAVSGMGVLGDHEDMAALSALIRAAPAEMLPVLAVKETANKAWEAIRSIRVGASRVREATAQRLRREFEQIFFKNGESLDSFGMRIRGVVNNLRSRGDTMEEIKVSGC